MPKGPELRYARRTLSPKLLKARALAVEIEELLGGLTPEEKECCGYQLRLAQGLSRALIDQLEELEGTTPSVRNLLGNGEKQDVGS